MASVNHPTIGVNSDWVVDTERVSHDGINSLIRDRAAAVGIECPDRYYHLILLVGRLDDWLGVVEDAVEQVIRDARRISISVRDAQQDGYP